MLSRLMPPLRRAAEGVLVLMMGILFTTFIAQVIFRYVLNLPLAWSDEICNFIWLWGILWGASFVMRDHEVRPVRLSKKECLSCHPGMKLNDPVALIVYSTAPFVKAK